MFLSKIPDKSQPPQKIISLVPSITELLFDLGLDNEVTGITKFCTNPPDWHNTKTIIGGTKNIHSDKIISLEPDLIIANKEENIKEQVMTLAERFPVWLTDVNTIEDNYQMILDIGQITGRQEKPLEIANKIKASFSKLKHEHF